MRHKWKSTKCGNLDTGLRNVDICIYCNMTRHNAYRGKIMYYTSDNIPTNKAGECKGI